MKLLKFVKNSFQKAKENLGKVAAAALALLVGGSSTPASAAVTFDGTAFAGTFDLAPYYSAITIIVGAIAVIAAIGLAIRQFKRV